MEGWTVLFTGFKVLNLFNSPLPLYPENVVFYFCGWDSKNKHTFSVSKLTLGWLDKRKKKGRDRLWFANLWQTLHWNTVYWLYQSWCVFKSSGNLNIWEMGQISYYEKYLHNLYDTSHYETITNCLWVDATWILLKTCARYLSNCYNMDTAEVLSFLSL